MKHPSLVLLAGAALVVFSLLRALPIGATLGAHHAQHHRRQPGGGAARHATHDHAQEGHLRPGHPASYRSERAVLRRAVVATYGMQWWSAPIAFDVLVAMVLFGVFFFRCALDRSLERGPFRLREVDESNESVTRDGASPLVLLLPLAGIRCSRSSATGATPAGSMSASPPPPSAPRCSSRSSCSKHGPRCCPRASCSISTPSMSIS